MSIKVNQKCIGCGNCVELCPNNFATSDDGRAQAISQDINDCARQAARECPMGAIEIEEA